MRFGIHIRRLWRFRASLVACGTLALLTAVCSVVKITFPLGVTPRALKLATASTQVVVDTPRSALLDLRQSNYSMDALTNRAVLLGNVMASPPIRESIARRARVPVGVLQVTPPLTPKQPRAVAEPSDHKHTSDILKLNDQYRLNIQANPTVPVLHIYAQAPTARSAEAMANGAVDAMQAYLLSRAHAADTPESEQLRMVQLGRARGAVINKGIEWQVAELAFLLTFGLSCTTVVFLFRVVGGWRLAALSERTAG